MLTTQLNSIATPDNGEPSTEATRTRSRRSRLVFAAVAAVVCVGVYALSNLTAWGQTVENGLITGLDAQLSFAFVPYKYLHIPPLQGEVPTIVVGLVLVILIAAFRRRWRDLFTVLVALPLSIGVDEVVARSLVKPALESGVPIWDLTSSFPSGHVTIAAAVSTAILIVVPRGWIRWCAPILLGWIALVSAAVLGLGWHRPSDVFGSVTLVAAFFLASSAIFTRTTEPVRRAELPIALIVAVVVILAAVCAVAPPAWLVSIFAAVSIIGTGLAGFIALRWCRPAGD